MKYIPKSTKILSVILGILIITGIITVISVYFIKKSQILSFKPDIVTVDDPLFSNRKNGDYIIHFINSKTSQSKTVGINADSFDNTSPQFVNGKLYYFDKKIKVLTSVDYQGNFKQYNFVGIGFLDSSNFKISQDGKKIAWGIDDNYKNSKIYVSDIDGNNEKMILNKNYNPNDLLYARIIDWANDDNSIYYTNQPGELGGYIIFDGYYGGLEQVSLDGSNKEIVSATASISNILAVSHDNKTLAYGKNMNIVQNTTQGALIIKNISDGSDKVINEEKGYAIAGTAYFNSDDNKLVYSEAKDNPDNEQVNTFLIDLKTYQKTKIADNYMAQGWLNNKVLLEPYSANNYYGTYTIDTSGNNLKKISDLSLSK